MSNKSNSSALPTTALPDTAATTLVATSRKHSHRPSAPANASAPLRSASCISTYFSIAHVGGQWPHPAPNMRGFPKSPGSLGAPTSDSIGQHKLLHELSDQKARRP